MIGIFTKFIAGRQMARSRKRTRQAGITTVDAVMGAGALLVIAGVIELLAMAMSASGRPADLAAHTAEYARSKMEQLVTLCGGSDSIDGNLGAPVTRESLSVLPGCTDHSDALKVPANGGRLDVSSPVARYVDYLDASGKPASPTSRWEYVRVWQITVPPGGSNGTKQIAVKAQARHLAPNGVAPQSTIVTTRTFPLH